MQDILFIIIIVICLIALILMIKIISDIFRLIKDIESYKSSLILHPIEYPIKEMTQEEKNKKYCPYPITQEQSDFNFFPDLSAKIIRSKSKQQMKKERDVSNEPEVIQDLYNNNPIL